jgi:hypothetical protein
MKETTAVKPTAIPISDLIVDGVYWNAKTELCKVMNVDNEKKQVKILNLSEQMTVYLDFKRCILVKRIR